MRSSEINRTRLRTAVLILFLLQTLMLPAAIGVTYASRSLRPEHILTYSAGRLVWDAATDTDSSGAARLRLFDTAYSHVDSGDGAEVVAPGTEGGSLVRLKNEGGSTVTYTAVLYRLRTEDMPVQAALEGEGFADTAEYALPENAAREDVLRAVTGTVEAGRIQDFDIQWLWRFDDGPVQDQADTALGDSAAAGRAARVTLGFFLVVSEEPGQWIRPTNPKTGDRFPLGWYVGMMAVTGTALAVLGLGGRRRRSDEDEKGGQTGR